MKSSAVLLIIFLALIAGTVVIVKYNSMSAMDEKVVTAWTPLEGSLRERYDSIPKLMTTIVAYVGHDIPDDDALTAAWPRFGQARTIEQRVRAANAIEDLGQRLTQDVKVHYPGISDNNQVDAAEKIIRASGAKLGAALPAYNKAATDYNTYIRQFPNNLIAAVFGFAESYAYLQPQM